MLTPTPEIHTQGSESHRDGHIVLELTVNNHPGVMSHICGLFSRRAYNVEGILCMPVGKGERSRIWLLVDKDQRLDQMTKQVMKLEDVLEVHPRGADHQVFVELEAFFMAGATS
jgi:acetolactate synthase-1/3 small subunit